MPTISIIPADGYVVIDRVVRIVDCSSVHPTIHAIQWNGRSGSIEYVDDDPDDGQRRANDTITSIEPYQGLINAWAAADPMLQPAPPPPVVPQSPEGGADVVA